MQSREVRACWRAEPREVRAQNYTLRKERAAQGGGSLQAGQVTHHLQGSRESLIFEGVIFFLWNHPFYCAVCRPDLKTVFVFKIGPILVVRVKI